MAEGADGDIRWGRGTSAYVSPPPPPMRLVTKGWWTHREEEITVKEMTRLRSIAEPQRIEVLFDHFGYVFLGMLALPLVVSALIVAWP